MLNSLIIPTIVVGGLTGLYYSYNYFSKKAAIAIATDFGKQPFGYILAITKDDRDNMLIIERLIDADMVDGKELRIGVCKTNNENSANPFGNQCLKIGKDLLFRLKTFSQNDNTLIYRFEHDVILTIGKRVDGTPYYNLKGEGYDITKPIQPLIGRIYKTIGMNSPELDKMSTYLQ